MVSWPSGFFQVFLKIPGICQKFGIFFLTLGIFIPGIRDFFSLRIFIPRIRDFFSLGIFIPGIRDFS